MKVFIDDSNGQGNWISGKNPFHVNVPNKIKKFLGVGKESVLFGIIMEIVSVRIEVPDRCSCIAFVEKRGEKIKILFSNNKECREVCLLEIDGNKVFPGSLDAVILERMIANIDKSGLLSVKKKQFLGYLEEMRNKNRGK